METFYVPLAAGVGAVVAGILGWLETGEAFSSKKYLPTILRAAVAAMAGAVAAPIVGPIGWTVIGGAFMAGIGVDAGLKRLVGTIKK